MTIANTLAGAVTLGAALLLGSGLFTSPAQAGYVVTLQEVGSDVVATGSGPIDLAGLGGDFGKQCHQRYGTRIRGDLYRTGSC